MRAAAACRRENRAVAQRADAAKVKSVKGPRRLCTFVRCVSLTMAAGVSNRCCGRAAAQVADTNGDGRMNYEEFLKLMTERKVRGEGEGGGRPISIYLSPGGGGRGLEKRGEGGLFRACF